MVAFYLQIGNGIAHIGISCHYFKIVLPCQKIGEIGNGLDGSTSLVTGCEPIDEDEDGFQGLRFKRTYSFGHSSPNGEILHVGYGLEKSSIQRRHPERSEGSPDFEYLLVRSFDSGSGDSSCRVMFIANPELELPTFRMTVEGSSLRIGRFFMTVYDFHSFMFSFCHSE